MSAREFHPPLRVQRCAPHLVSGLPDGLAVRRWRLTHQGHSHLLRLLHESVRDSLDIFFRKKGQLLSGSKLSASRPRSPWILLHWYVQATQAGRRWVVSSFSSSAITNFGPVPLLAHQKLLKLQVLMLYQDWCSEGVRVMAHCINIAALCRR